MALVAYSDESDYSDHDDEDNSPEITKPKINGTSNNNKTEKLDASSKIDEEHSDTEIFYNKDDENEPVSHLLSAIPKPALANRNNPEFNIENEDIVDDVPTVSTWNITKNIKNTEKDRVNTGKKRIAQPNSKKTKLKLILPALSEFDDDEEDVVEDICPRKKVKPSSGGTGLFAVLPKPRGSTFLVPLHVSRKTKAPKPPPIKQKKSVKPALKVSNDSDEEDMSKVDSCDFFSLANSPETTPDLPAMPNLPSSSIEVNSHTLRNEPPDYVVPTAYEEPAASAEPEQFISFENPALPSSSGIDEEAFRRLAGRRNRGEVPQIIDVHADDALMKREEWVTRALCDEKPKRSFSKKREGNPTQQQKRKHQITYLAHQAQEREQDLQNTWGQNRFTKMQTQSRYGF